MNHHIGQQFGNYVLLRFLGRGGFAEVYLGEQVYLKTQAALKILHIQLTHEQAQTFLQEAQTIAHLEHPHIIKVLEFGMQESTPFLVMHHAPHGTLRARHPHGSRLPAELIVSYARQVAAALQHAHDHHLIHRDVKPENVLLGTHQEILLGDFGLAVVAHSSSHQVLQKVVGTLPYMAPEQLHGKPCMTSDQYALGIMVYEWLCGTPPFTGSISEMAMQHLKAPPPSLREKLPGLAPAVEQVVFKALSKQPSERFATIAAFATALEEAFFPTEAKPSENPFLVRSSPPRALPYLGRCQQRPLVGREQEWKRLHSLLLEIERESQTPRAEHVPLALSGSETARPSCLLLLGEAGIGKTRLAEELSREAHQRGWAVVWSRGYPQESGIPYQLWTELLRHALRQDLWPLSNGETTSRLVSSLSALIPLVPEVVDLLPGDERATPAGVPEPEQRRIWEATFALLVAMSERAPLLLILDDLHWTDRSSLELLGYLVRRLVHHRILLLGTCRKTDLPSTHPLNVLHDTLPREQVLDTLYVPTLTTDEIGRLVAEKSTPLKQHIQRYAAGNPFFAEELARVAEDAGSKDVTSLLTKRTIAVLPQTITALLNLRLNRLSPACQRLLARAAVLGGVFDLHALHAIEPGSKTLDDDSLLDLLEEALQAGVLVEESSGTHIAYRFWHPLLASHLYSGLSADRRAHLHLRVAQNLQRIYAGREEEGAATIAHHLVNGGAESSLIAYYAELAGNRAYALSAYPEVEQHYRLAVEQRGALPEDASLDERLRFANLLERLGECTRVQGKSEIAQHFFEQALEVRHLSSGLALYPDPRYEAQIDALLWVEIGKTWFDRGDFELAEQHNRQAEQLLRDAGVATGSSWATLRLEQSYILWRKGEVVSARCIAYQALKMFEEVVRSQVPAKTNIDHTTAIRRTLDGDPVDLGRTHILLASIAAVAGQSPEALDHLNTALTIFEHYDRPREIALVCGNIGDAYLRRTELSLAQDALLHSLRVAERIGEVSIMSVAFGNLGIIAARTGNIIEAEVLYRRGLTLAEQVNDPIIMSLCYGYLTLALRDQNKLHEARYALCQALKIARSRSFAYCVGSALIALGHIHLAQAMLEEETHTHSPGGLKGSRGDACTRLLQQAKISLQRALTCESLDAEMRAEAQVTLAEVWFLSGEAETAYQQAREAMEQARQYELPWLLIAAKRLLGNIFMAQGLREQAVESFEQALQEYRACGMRLEYAQTLQQYGIALLQWGSPEEMSYQQGLSYLREARELFSEYHASFDLQRTERMLIAYDDTPQNEVCVIV